MKGKEEKNNTLALNNPEMFSNQIARGLWRTRIRSSPGFI